MPTVQQLLIDLSPIRLELAKALTTVAFDPKTSIDIVVRAWELAEIDPAEYYDELMSVVYDELYSSNAIQRFRGHCEGGENPIDVLCRRFFDPLHGLLLTLRPYLYNAIVPYRTDDQYEYSITDIQLMGAGLLIELVRTDKIADYYRTNQDVTRRNQTLGT